MSTSDEENYEENNKMKYSEQISSPIRKLEVYEVNPEMSQEFITLENGDEKYLNDDEIDKSNISIIDMNVRQNFKLKHFRIGQTIYDDKINHKKYGKGDIIPIVLDDKLEFCTLERYCDEHQVFVLSRKVRVDAPFDFVKGNVNKYNPGDLVYMRMYNEEYKNVLIDKTEDTCVFYFHEYIYTKDLSNFEFEENNCNYPVIPLRRIPMVTKTLKTLYYNTEFQTLLKYQITETKGDDFNICDISSFQDFTISNELIDKVPPYCKKITEGSNTYNYIIIIGLLLDLIIKFMM